MALPLFLLIKRLLRKKIEDLDYLKDPYTEVLFRITKLEKTKLKPTESLKVYYNELSGVFRRFLERQFGLHAAELTTRELKEELLKLDLKPEVYEKSGSFFELLDIVKFANWTPHESQFSQDLKSARDLAELLHQPLSRDTEAAEKNL